jgi:flavin-dependent dehydrogenase
VTLFERERFPRHKLCGEFISPECLAHFRELGVLDSMLAAGGDRIRETRFYSPGGRSVSIASDWFSEAGGALGLSRAEMDHRMLTAAREAGAEVFEETTVTGVVTSNGNVTGIRAKAATGPFEREFDLVLDATGRAAAVARHVISQEQRAAAPSRLVGFKTHLENVSLERGVCEIYFFDGGYGGLSYIEQGRANHCFLVGADVVRREGSADAIVDRLIMRNERARRTLSGSRNLFDWIAVAVKGFGRNELAPAPNLLSIGDAAAFIDPFTGSGMLMALEVAEAAVESIIAGGDISAGYRQLFEKRFARRLRFCSMMRRAAFRPRIAATVISLLSVSASARRFLANQTRRRS